MSSPTSSTAAPPPVVQPPPTSSNICEDAKMTVVDEFSNMKEDIQSTKASVSTFFAIFCVLLVLVGNVILLIALNFWLSIMPLDSMAHNSSQIAIQVVSMMFMLLFFTTFVVAFLVKYGFRPLWRVLVGGGRVGGPWYRLFLLFASGASNGISSVLSIYAMTYTPQFLQAVLLCAIPFSAQAWTVLFIPVERKRNYLSLFFIASFLFFAGGVVLSSWSSFTDPEIHASVPWTFIYLISSIVFGLWCVVQRLYLDAVAMKADALAWSPEKNPGEDEQKRAGSNYNHLPNHEDDDDNDNNEEEEAAVQAEADAQLQQEEEHQMHPGKLDGTVVDNTTAVYVEPVDGEPAAGSEDEDALATAAQQHQRQWGQQSIDDTAAKLALLYVGVFFQIIVTFVCFPVDAIPWFGTSATVVDAWGAFANSVNFIFDSWINVRYGLLYSLGFAMSFIGCAYLNEHSPTLSSVVLQLAGPVTSLMIVLVPQWNVYHDVNHVGEKIGGIILLFCAAFLYHFWDQHSSRMLQAQLDHEAAAAAAAGAVEPRQRRAESLDAPDAHLYREGGQSEMEEHREGVRFIETAPTSESASAK